MKKNKIALKLILNFAIALLTFSIIIGSIFLFLFRSYTVEIHKNELLNYAKSLSAALSSEENMMPGRGIGGYGAYFRFISDVAHTDVWILDENLNLITSGKGQGMMNNSYNLADLPPNADELIDDVFLGNTSFSEGFSQTLAKPTLTVGTPLKNQSGDLIGAVLLHSPIDGTTAAINNGISILVGSIILALIVTSLLSILLSYSFTKPLSKMKNTALQLSYGNYSAQCDVDQNDEIGELADTIDILALRLEESSKESQKLENLRRDFVANISHELRTPITVIRGSLQALYDKVVSDPEKIEEYHRQMLNEAKFLERLVGDLLDLSKLQNIDFAIEMSPVNLGDVIADVLRSAQQLSKKKDVHFKTNISYTPISINGDYGRLRQMFLILIDNAIKFSPQSGLIQINATENKVSIRDQGKGIDENQISHIFDRFYKTQGEINKSGTGLGLAIAKQIAERHGVLLTAKNHIDGGAEFICQIPIFKKD